MARSSNPSDNSAVAQRLITLRLAMSRDNQTAFAKRIGIEVKRWNNFERGSPLSKDVAFTLVQKFPGLTLDWLWLGEDGGLSVKLQRELEEAGKAITEASGESTTS